MKIKKIAPVYYRYFKIQNKEGISLRNSFFVSLISFSFSMLNAALTSLIVANAPTFLLFFTAIIYYIMLLFSVKVMAFSKTYGKILLVLFSAIGFITGVKIF